MFPATVVMHLVLLIFFLVKRTRGGPTALQRLYSGMGCTGGELRTVNDELRRHLCDAKGASRARLRAFDIARSAPPSRTSMAACVMMRHAFTNCQNG